MKRGGFLETSPWGYLPLQRGGINKILTYGCLVRVVVYGHSGIK